MRTVLPLGVLSGLLSVLACSEAHAASTFDEATAKLSLPKDAARTWDFETGAALVGASFAEWTVDGGAPSVSLAPLASAGDAEALLVAGDADHVEGNRALRLSGRRGLVLSDAALFDGLAKGKMEVTLWARADGTTPQVSVIYDRDVESAIGSRTPFASVRAVPTGRETSDGWAELSTGPIDASVWGVPARAILVMPSYYAVDKDAFVIDALDVRRVDGKPMEAKACTTQNVGAVCGDDGDCMFGRCVASTFTWGVLPEAAHRSEIAERWVHWSTRLMGDRNAAAIGLAKLTPDARALAKVSRSSREFFGGMNRLVNELRDNHTSFGSPANYSSFAPQVLYGTSSGLGACFGVVDKDIMGGGRGFAVFRATSGTPLTGKKLERGDVIVSIDGRDPKEWVDDVWHTSARTLPNDPTSDWGSAAVDLSTLITVRANTVTVARCASADACDADHREVFTLDVASKAYQAVVADAGGNGESFACSARFTDAVERLAQPGRGEDAVSTQTGAGGETRVQFDGFVGRGTWQSTMTSVFSARPAAVVMDARMGHGGYYQTVEHLFHLLRGTSDPMGVFSVGRGSYDEADPAWLLDQYRECTTSRGDQWSCFVGNANGFFANVADPPGKETKIAWLNTYDVSANDFMPRLLKGRAGFRVFAPHATAGAFGAISSLPSLYPGWSGGSIQVQDARFAAGFDGVASARWESGHGVEPDEVVAEKLSDAISGVDTILTAATTWLASQ